MSLSYLEEEGFEPIERAKSPLPVFRTGVINLSATPPNTLKEYHKEDIIDYSKKVEKFFKTNFCDIVPISVLLGYIGSKATNNKQD